MMASFFRDADVALASDTSYFAVRSIESRMEYRTIKWDRQQLYEAIWEKPAVRLVREYGGEC